VSDYERMLETFREVGVKVAASGESEHPKLGALRIEIDHGASSMDGYYTVFFFDAAGKFIEHRLWC
jgi:hypothetical protein